MYVSQATLGYQFTRSYTEQYGHIKSTSRSLYSSREPIEPSIVPSATRLWITFNRTYNHPSPHRSSAPYTFQEDPAWHQARKSSTATAATTSQY